MVWINKRENKRDYKAQDAAKVEHAKLYNNARWRVASKAFRIANPLCKECEKHGAIKAAEVVDHIKPHKGNLELFWNVDNWQSLCCQCHNAKSARE
jgi:5-methylcytosine-specific restriction enzyme A